MIYRAGAVLEEGQWAEKMVVDVLNLAGIPTRPATDWEDHELKVDLWSMINGKELPIQVSTNRSAIAGPKGLDAIHRGVVPSWVNAIMLERAIETGDATPVVTQFVAQVEAVLRGFPNFRPLARRYA